MILLTVAAACEGNDSPSLTILEPPAANQTGEVLLEGIQRIEGFYAMGWISDREMIGTSASTEARPHLFIRDVIKGSMKDAGVEAGTSVNVSPDGKHAVIHQNRAFQVEMVDLAGGAGKRLPFDTRWTEGSWINGDTFLTAAAGSAQVPKLYRVNTAGIIETVSLAEFRPEQFIVKVEGKGNRLYTLDSGNQLTVMETESLAVLWQEDEVTDFALSPDGKQIVFVADTGSNQKSMLIAESSRGIQRKTVAKGRLIQQISWSPAGDKLAFSAFSLDQGMTGLYVMNASTGHMTSVSYQQNLKSSIEWNPSGSSFMVSEMQPGELTDTLSTTLYRLK
ncbi:PD40 domain-containing protein [Paenibacillus lutrae]|uniref:Uncharacterized protein n=1 Tax=Paenibacillus lutrae TaxID=2078573 RepID=A0A7X3FKN9_9BACL|nr:PD40 domain-containing protein [Paenibacillus lutrae]MVP01112.1 hypothetical protein [Paenibacillus lutrae]